MQCMFERIWARKPVYRAGHSRPRKILFGLSRDRTHDLRFCRPPLYHCAMSTWANSLLVLIFPDVGRKVPTNFLFCKVFIVIMVHFNGQLYQIRLVMNIGDEIWPSHKTNVNEIVKIMSNEINRPVTSAGREANMYDVRYSKYDFIRTKLYD